MKKEMEYEIGDEAKKGCEKGFVELTEEDMNDLIEHGFEDKMENGVEHNVERLEMRAHSEEVLLGAEMWKESTKL